MDCVHQAQRRRAHLELACCGHMPVQIDPRALLTMVETDSVFHIVIEEDRPAGPAVFTFVGDYPLDWWPCLTAEKAQQRAADLAGFPTTPDARRVEGSEG